VATNVGLTGDCFAGIAFHSNGTLYGVTGDGAAIRESLFTLSTATGAATFLRVLGNGTGGEVIAFNPNDALIYHASGCDICGLSVFESINPVSLVVTNIPQSGLAHKEITALTHSDGTTLLMVDLDNFLFAITTNGVVSLRGGSPLNHQAKGLAFVPRQRADFDRDVKSDLTVYRAGTWLTRRSGDGGITAVGWGGAAQDIPVLGDYDGDGKSDQAVYRDGNWLILRSSDGGVTATGWGGLAQDKPVPADYDGDGKTDIAIYRDGNWFILRSSEGGVTATGWVGLAQD
jgi:hypothetical protein